jgi:hypothetical protein
LLYSTSASAFLLSKVYLETGAIRVGKMLYIFGAFTARSKTARKLMDERGMGNLL